MDFQQAENRFKELKAQFEAGTLTETQFKTQLEELMVQDERGDWWMIGYETERWYRHDGTNWVQVDPPSSFSQKPTPVVTSVPKTLESKVAENVAREQAERKAADIVSREQTERNRKPKEAAERLAKPKLIVDPIFREGLTQIPLAAFLLMAGFSYFYYLIFIAVLSAIFALLSGIFMILRKKILSNRFFIYSLLAYLVFTSLTTFIPVPLWFVYLFAILAGGSLFWFIFNPKLSSYYSAPYSSIVFALFLFINVTDYLGIYIPLSYFLYSGLGLLTAILIFTRK